MPPFASIEIDPIPLTRNTVAVSVYRYTPAGPQAYQPLPNIKVLRIEFREGADPGVAQFRYVFDAANPPTDPMFFQDVLSTDSNLSGVVANDDRLVVLGSNPDGTSKVLFDGFAQLPELSLSPSREQVTFLAFGVAIRAWDTPIGGALMRDADSPATVLDLPTDVETHFNPQGEPNATPAGADAVDSSGNLFPTFLDRLTIRTRDVRRKWTLSMAVRYLCFSQNSGQAYVQNPAGDLIDALLDSRAPRSASRFDPSDPTTYTSQPILVPDYPATGKDWPTVVHDLLKPNGFGMAFRLETGPNGEPRTTLDIFRRQDGDSSTTKDVYLQAFGEPFDPARTNVGEAQLARDITGIANAYKVESALVRHEASFVLAPGFPISPTDAADSGAIGAFDKSDASFAGTNHDQYRLFILDETGEGHWDFKTSAIVSKAPPLSSLFGGNETDQRAYVKRRRVPLGELFSLDLNQKPLKARLAISTDFAGVSPGLWDGTGTWQTIVGGFDLLTDRLGIWVNVANPNGWNIGASQVPGVPYPAGIVRGVEDLAASGRTRFTLRLTCVVEGDSILNASAARRSSSPTSFAITRRVDARDRYVKHVKAARSEFNPTKDPVVMRDDTSDAQADADARRLAGEAGRVTGSVTIPRFSNAYRIGDRIRSIQGRDLGLRTNAGAPSIEAEVFPAVVGLTWDFDGKQRTILHLSDQRGEGR